MEPAEWIEWVSSGPVPADWRDHVEHQAVEQFYLAWLAEDRAEPPLARPGSMVIDDLRLVGAFPDTAIEIEFRAPRRYGDSRYGMRWPLWRDHHGWDAIVFWVNVVEWVDASNLHLPNGRSGVHWIE